MSVLIEDSPRPFQAGWIMDAVRVGTSAGAVMTPFATPWQQHTGAGKKPSLRTRAAELAIGGVPLWFDATTHALQMGGVGDFRYYEEYDLWAAARGDLTTPALRDQHVRKVFDIQDAIGAQHLAPTILLHTGLSDNSALSLELAREAIRQDPSCWLSVAGTAPFWASGRALDAHIGALAALEPAGWFLTVARTVNAIPVDAEVEEVHGLCRAVRALTEDAPVHISHGDLAGLPAVAAGAATVGSGWDKRQRVCSYSDYAARTTGASGGGWYERPTVRDLAGSLSIAEGNILVARDMALATRLGGLPAAPGPKEAFTHHLLALNEIISAIAGAPNYELRYRVLAARYTQAAVDWPLVEGVTNCAMAAPEWIIPVADGLALYAGTEGW